MAEYKFWQRRESRNMKVAKNQNLILEAIAQLRGGDAAAVVRPRQMKVVMKKEDLEQLLEAIRDRRGPPSSFEQRLNLLRRRQMLRAAAQAKGKNRSGSWRPVLQSIPEEI